MKLLPIVISLFILSLTARSQQKMDVDSLVLDSGQIKKFIEKVSEKSNETEERLTEKSRKTLRKIIKEEQKVYQKLSLIDSNAAKEAFAGIFEKYALLEKSLDLKATKAIQKGFGTYLPYLDTVKTSLNFLSQGLNTTVSREKIGASLHGIDNLKNRFEQTRKIQEFIRQRKVYLTQRLERFGLVKDLKKINKELFYYSQTIKSYKDVLSDPKKIERAALAALRKSSLFTEFFKRNSQLASFFGIGSGVGSGSSSLIGLQSRASVQQIIAQRIGPTATPASFVTQQIQKADEQLAEIREKAGFLDAFDDPVDVPDFKPNMQKTKPLLQRLEYGANVQFGNTNRFLPTTADFALTIGYKLNDNGSVGIGTSYKLGLGKGIQNIRFSHQGFGFRSYVDWKLRGTIYLSGGYEKLYLPSLGNSTYQFQTWQESGLMGLSKKYKLSKKWKGSIQLLYDFLGTYSFPVRQPIVIRTGCNL